MTVTELTIDWSATDELTVLGRKLMSGIGSRVTWFRGYGFWASDTEDNYVIRLKQRLETMPKRLQDVRMSSIEMIKHNSPVTFAVDGPYEDGNITGRVETYIKDGTAQQSIRIKGTNGTTVEELNQWFDDLIQGKKNEKNTNPVKAISPRVVLRGSGGSGPSFRKVEVELNGAPNQLVTDVAEVLATHFENLEGPKQ